MREDVRRDMFKGIQDLQKTIPLLSANCPDFGNGAFKPVLQEDGRAAVDLDILAGVDGYQVWNICMRGVAVRAQRDDHRPGYPYRTFTIREGRPSGARTEYEKRLWAIKHKNEGAIYPYWTLHTYMSDDGSELRCAGLAKTEELYLWIERMEMDGRKFYRNYAGKGGEKFLCVPWDEYRRSGLYFFEYPKRFPLTPQEVAIINAMSVAMEYQHFLSMETVESERWA